MCCQRCATRDVVTAQLEAVHAFSTDHFEMMCNGLLDAVANSTINHSGYKAAAERLYRHGDLCVAAAPLEPLVLPARRWWAGYVEAVARNSAPLFMTVCMLGGFLIGRLH